MNYRSRISGRIVEDPSEVGRVLTFAEVQERLVEAMILWRRSPGGGRWPFAGDGPWHLVRDDGSWQAAWDHNLNALQTGRPATEKPRPLPLSRAEVAERDRVSEWLRFVPERDRRLVVLALTQLARGHSSPRWSVIRPMLNAEIGTRGLAQRYSRAITNIVKSLKRLGDGVSIPMVIGDENKGCSPLAS